MKEGLRVDDWNWQMKESVHGKKTDKLSEKEMNSSITLEGESIERELLQIDAQINKEGGAYFSKQSGYISASTSASASKDLDIFSKKLSRSSPTKRTPSTAKTNRVGEESD
jgi:predicted phage gp36 major capsid-like protein